MGLFSASAGGGNSSPWGQSSQYGGMNWNMQPWGGQAGMFGGSGGNQPMPGTPNAGIQPMPGAGGNQPMLGTAPGGDTPDLFGIGGSGVNPNGSTTKQTTTVTPWDPQGDALKSIYSQAQTLYNQNQKLAPVGFDPASTQALNRMAQLANNPSGVVQEANAATQNIASGKAGITTSGMFNNIYADMNRPGMLDQGMYRQMAQGGLVGANPYRDQAIQQSMDDATNQINAQFTGGGRYTGRMGSSAYGDAAARQLGNIATTARMQGYDTDTQNFMNAAQGRSGEDLARTGLGLSAAQGQTGVQGQNIANRMQASSMADAINKARYTDPQMLAQVGGAKEAMLQSQRDYGTDNLAKYQAMVGGVPGQAGTSQVTQPKQPWWQSLLGGGLALGGALGGLFGGA